MNAGDLFTVLKRIPIPTCLYDAEAAAFVNVNDKALLELGYDHDEFLALKLGEVFRGNEHPPLFDLPPAQSPQPFSTALRVLTKSGRSIHADAQFDIWDQQGRALWLISFAPIHEQTIEHRTLEARLRIGEFAHSHPLNDVLQKTLDEAEALTDSIIGFFHFVAEDQVTLQFQNWSTNTVKNMCTADGKYSHYAIDKAGVWVDCVRERRPVIHNDYASLSHKKWLPPGHAQLARILTVPIMRAGKIVGILGVGNKSTPYDEADVRAISLLADLAWDITDAKRNEESLSAIEYNYRSVMDQAADGIFIADQSGRYIDVNTAGCAMLGYTREEILQNSIQSLVLVDEVEPLRLDELREGANVITRRKMRHKDGHPISVEVSAKMLSDGRFLGIVRNITQRQLEEDRIRYLAFVMSRISNAVISTDTALCVTQWNEAAEHLYGWKEAEVLGRNIDEVCRTEFSDEQKAEAQNTLLTQKKWQGELKQHHRDGQELWVWASVTLLEDAHGNFIGGVTINHDITKRKQMEEDLRRTKDSMEEINIVLQRAFEREQLASRTDSLTGVFSRRYFFELLDYELAASLRYQRQLSLIMFDIDHFKKINDEYGHITGDEVLRRTAQTVREHLRETDILARYGGDEFVILLPNSSPQDALRIFHRAVDEMQAFEFAIVDGEIKVTLSAGIAGLENGVENPSRLVHLADQALYAAKQKGRNRISVYANGGFSTS